MVSVRITKADTWNAGTGAMAYQWNQVCYMGGEGTQCWLPKAPHTWLHSSHAGGSGNGALHLAPPGAAGRDMAIFVAAPYAVLCMAAHQRLAHVPSRTDTAAGSSRWRVLCMAVRSEHGRWMLLHNRVARAQPPTRPSSGTLVHHGHGRTLNRLARLPESL